MKDLIKKFIPSFLLGWYHYFLSFLAAVFYCFPSRKIKVVGVTGTNGKSTTVEMAARVLEEAGRKAASLSSIKFKIKEKEWKNMFKMTMPGRFEIQKFLKKALKSGCQYAIVEVTSEGIKQHRHRFINFEAAIFTNLSPEHIEAHGSFEKYREAKGKLFSAAKNIHIINAEDKNAEYFLQFAAKKKYTYGLKQGNVNNEKLQLKLQLIGEFNAYNALAAVSFGLSQGIDLETCKKAIEKIKGVPGRMELIIKEPFKVFIDYAFTPNALRKVYKTLRNSKFEIRNSKLICVLGACGGGRDKWKRPVLGEIAAKYCDKIIVTNEDPYDEDPREIIEQVAAGAKGKAEKIIDRKEAIRKALKSAKPNDVVIITGKGCEPWICLEKGKKIPWNEKQAIIEEFENLKNFSETK